MHVADRQLENCLYIWNNLCCSPFTIKLVTSVYCDYHHVCLSRRSETYHLTCTHHSHTQCYKQVPIAHNNKYMSFTGSCSVAHKLNMSVLKTPLIRGHSIFEICNNYEKYLIYEEMINVVIYLGCQDDISNS